MFEGIRKILSGKDVFARLISLFSICGIAGLLNGHFALYLEDIVQTDFTQKIIFMFLLILFSLFFTGYEILFFKERELPDIDMRSIKLAFRKVPFAVFLISTFIMLFSICTKYEAVAFGLELLFSVPLTMALAGFSYNYDNGEAWLLFKKLSFKDCIVLLLKWLLVLVTCYLITLVIVVFLFIVGGIIFAIVTKTDTLNFVNVIAMNKLMLTKFSNYITGIVLIYIMTLGSLVWNYEVIKTFENK